uniref:Uncharacterized protein n=1 Tax=Opuntia streptacantha TaxID=393608 RepID=A0A7C8Z3K5_OPUST
MLHSSQFPNKAEDMKPQIAQKYLSYNDIRCWKFHLQWSWTKGTPKDAKLCKQSIHEYTTPPPQKNGKKENNKSASTPNLGPTLWFSNIEHLKFFLKGGQGRDQREMSPRC